MNYDWSGIAVMILNCDVQDDGNAKLYPIMNWKSLFQVSN
jgi:hypothetical protein